jgi:hypothetical protein
MSQPRVEPDHESSLGSPPSMPRWVKVLGIMTLILVLLVGIMLLTGEHGPGRHAPSADVARETPRSAITEDETPSGGAPGGHTPPFNHGAQQP